MENKVEAGKWCPLKPVCAKVTSETEAAGVFCQGEKCLKVSFMNEVNEIMATVEEIRP